MTEKDRFKKWEYSTLRSPGSGLYALCAIHQLFIYILVLNAYHLHSYFTLPFSNHPHRHSSVSKVSVDLLENLHLMPVGFDYILLKKRSILTRFTLNNYADVSFWRNHIVQLAKGQKHMRYSVMPVLLLIPHCRSLQTVPIRFVCEPKQLENFLFAYGS